MEAERSDMFLDPAQLFLYRRHANSSTEFLVRASHALLRCAL